MSKIKNKARYGLTYLQDKDFRFSEKKRIIKNLTKDTNRLFNLDSKAERALNSAFRAIQTHSKSKGNKEKLKASRAKLDRAFSKLLKYGYTDEWGRQKSFIASKIIDGKKYYAFQRKIGVVKNNTFTGDIYDYDSFKAAMDADRNKLETTKKGKIKKSQIQQIIDYKEAFLFGNYADWADRVKQYFNIDDTVSDVKFESWVEKYIKEEMN